MGFRDKPGWFTHEEETTQGIVRAAKGRIEGRDRPRRVPGPRSDSIMKRLRSNLHAVSHGEHTATQSGGRGTPERVQ